MRVRFKDCIRAMQILRSVDMTEDDFTLELEKGDPDTTQPTTGRGHLVFKQLKRVDYVDETQLRFTVTGMRKGSPEEVITLNTKRLIRPYVTPFSMLFLAINLRKKANIEPLEIPDCPGTE